MADEVLKIAVTPIKQTLSVDAQFVDKLLQKTVEGKIVWERISNGHQGRSVDGFFIIELRASRAIFGYMWSFFSVKKGGEEILKLDNNSNGLLTLAGLSKNTVEEKVSDLLDYLESARTREVKKAIADLEKL
jgi:hypothetical protein